jgi:biopolymer transport protein ExbD
MRSGVHERGFAEVRLNMTPLIDVVFLLMIFFLLVAQIQRVARVEMDVPDIASAAAYRTADDDALVINVVPTQRVDAEGGWYRLGTRTFPGDADGLLALETAVRRAAAARGLITNAPDTAATAAPDHAVLIRADRAEDYARVEPVLGVLSRVGLRGARLVISGSDDDPTAPPPTNTPPPAG